MKKFVLVILSIALAVSLLCINVSAANTYTCQKCLSVGKAVRICINDVAASHHETVACTLRNQYFNSVFHRGDCNIERQYCWTYYFCNSCYSQYTLYEYHLCEVTHTSTEAGVLTDRVCPTFLGRNFTNDFRSRGNFTAINPDIILSGKLPA